MRRDDDQLSLAFHELAKDELKVVREEPRVWVQRLVLWHDLEAGNIRDIVLHRGLNIVWSPAGTDRRFFSTGHAAGKSLFCRFVRFCLGEESFADAEDTEEIRSRFSNGAVGAEVRVGGATWCVLRSFRNGVRAIARQGTDILAIAGEQANDDFSAYLQAIADTVFDNEANTLLAPLGANAWSLLLPWLSRDQECRVDGLTHWRHPDSGSPSSSRALSADDRSRVMRIVLKIYNSEANERRLSAEKAAEQKREAERDLKQLQQSFDRLVSRIAAKLAIEERSVWPEALPDQEQSVEGSNTARLNALVAERLVKLKPSVEDAEHRIEIEELSKMSAEYQELENNRSDLEAELRPVEAALEVFTTKSAEAWRTVRESESLICPIDGLRIDRESTRASCPLIVLPDPELLRTTALQTDKVRDDIAARVKALHEQLNPILVRLQALKAPLQAKKTQVARREEELNARHSATGSLWSVYAEIRELAATATNRANAQEKADRCKNDHEKENDLHLEALSQRRDLRLGHWFNMLVKRVVAPDAEGVLSIDGNGLHPTIRWFGLRRSVALHSLQIVLFDIATMLCAVEGQAVTPALLLHDSPREGDLDEGTYGRIFDAVAELAGECASAPFQYIVTTTSKPPDSVIADALVLRLASRPAADRLLKVDL